VTAARSSIFGFGAPRPSVRAAVLLVLLAMLAGCAALAPKPLPPSVELAGLRVTRLAPTDTRLRVALTVRNPNPYALGLSALEATMTIEGERFATSALVAPVTVAASGEARVELDVRTDFGAVAAVADRMAKERRARYEMTGSAVVQDGMRLPFTRRGELPVGDLLGFKR
jgi:LEA14-like dessication related protein